MVKCKTALGQLDGSISKFNISKTIGGIKFTFTCSHISIKATNW